MDEFHDRMEEGLRPGGYNPKMQEVYLFHDDKVPAHAGRDEPHSSSADLSSSFFLRVLSFPRRLKDPRVRWRNGKACR